MKLSLLSLDYSHVLWWEVGSCSFWKRYILCFPQVKRNTILEEILCFWEVLSEPTSFQYLVLENQEITSCRFSINGVNDRFAWIEVSASGLLKWVLGHKTEMFEEWRCGISCHWHIAFLQGTVMPLFFLLARETIYYTCIFFLLYLKNTVSVWKQKTICLSLENKVL